MIPLESEFAQKTATLENSSFPVKDATSRGNNFNALRLLLAISVIFSHSYPVIFGLQTFDPIERFLRAQRDIPQDHPIDLGHLAVYGFFTISGYLVTMSWKRSRSVWDYLKKRMLRIYPGFLVVSLFCALVVGPLAAADPTAYWRALSAERFLFLPHLLLLDLKLPPTFMQMPVSGSINAPLWTISWEFQCYLMVIVLGLAATWISSRLPNKIRQALPGIFFAVVYTLYNLCCSHHLAAFIGLLHPNPATRLGHILLRISTLEGIGFRMYLYFLSGMCLYVYRNRISYRLPIAAAAVAVLLVSIFVVPLVAYLLPLAGSYLLLYLAFIPSPFSKIGTKNDLSYGLYLYAFPIQQLLVLYYGAYLSVPTLFSSALVIAFGLAFLSWHFVEAPCLKLKYRKPVAQIVSVSK